MFSATAGRPSLASLRVRRATPAASSAASRGVAGAMGAEPVVSTNVSATSLPVATSRACQKRAPVAAPWSRMRRKRPSETPAPGTRRGPRTTPADIGGGTGEALNVSEARNWLDTSRRSTSPTSNARSSSGRMKRLMPGMRCSARPRFCTSGSFERDSTRPVTTRKRMPSSATSMRLPRLGAPMSRPSACGKCSPATSRTSQRVPNTTATPTTAAPAAHTEVRSTSRARSVPSLRRSSSAPMSAPATKPKPLAAPSSTTTWLGSRAMCGASADSSTFVPVMPAMMKVGVHASSRA